MRIIHKDGHYVPIEIRVRTLIDQQGTIMGGVFVARNIAKRGKAELNLSRAPNLSFSDRRLTLRENEVLKWIMEGKSTWDISKILNISESTVKFHIANIMKKLSAVNRTHAIAISMLE